MSAATGIPEALISLFSDFIADRIGLHFPRDRWTDLERGMSAVAREFGWADTETGIRWLMSHSLTKGEIEMLASHLTVGETYFFREEKSFTALEEHIIPELIRRSRDGEKRLRIWSAGCCTGEEPYSVAILLSRMLPDLDDWNLTVLATDINPHFRLKALSGLYSDWSFRTTPPEIKERYFTKTAAGCFEIDPKIRARVAFTHLNLAEDVYPSLLNNSNAMDIILCRNVLMYFKRERAQRVINSFRRCLVDGGWLIVSPGETSQTLFSEFVTANDSGAVLYRKDDCRHRITVAVFPHGLSGLDTSSLPPRSAHAPKPSGRAQAISEPQKTHVARSKTGYPTPDVRAKTQMLYDQGRYEEAAEMLRALLAESPGNIEMMARLARTLANQGKLTEALGWCEKAVAMGKLNPASHYLLAVILQERGRVVDAVASLKRALYLDPDFVLAYFSLGNLVRQQGKHLESERHFQSALSILAKYPQDHSLPESEGMTAGRLREIIRAAVPRESVT